MIHKYFCEDCENKFKSDKSKCPSCDSIDVVIDEPIIRVPQKRV